ncbi:RNA ligase RtcB family protein [Pedosphaera parvula]|uniref:3'-phosphate/5'-hydroxy nucleic acid ligase n=1 Tax=Pedosphaera parvula (strain Ellin514) TaxID=320771 RepID=B9XDR4_PEDPL|nr:RNA ligase RtcB family protein [Pedosphaera parvula]EEF62210.1 release factor H-coupled RctB family protein [Pedosphaera parvula Ellin514]
MNSEKPNIRLIASGKDWIEGAAVDQLKRTAELPGMRLAVGFPDLHPGKGHPVGAAFVSSGTIYPYLIGNDIGCGMGFWQTDLLRRKAKLDRWAGRLSDLENPWEGDVGEWLQRAELPTTHSDHSLGTIGGGNHFAELQAVEKVEDETEFAKLNLSKEKLMLLVHSGSRGLGESILRAYVDQHRDAGVAVESTDAKDYLQKHDEAVRWAKANRSLIAHRFASVLNAACENVVDGSHNSITRHELAGETVWLHRKGAAPAETGPMIIPGSRGTVSYLVLPTGDLPAAAWSLAHGAGRKWTRSESKSRIRDRYRPDELSQTELGSRVICENRDLLYEEAPDAYKKIEVVIKTLVDEGLIRVIASLRPLITYKTRSSR